MIFHKPVLVQEVLEHLDPKPQQVYVDVTFGGGGHTRAILEKEPTCKVIAFDWDKTTLETNGVSLQDEFPDRLTLVWSNFSLLDRKLKELGIQQVDGILADFGTSFYQLTQKAGFSFYKDTELDMRMAPSHQKVTAAQVLNTASEQKLVEIFGELGQEPKSKILARAIVQERIKSPFRTTKQLAQLVERVVPWTKKGIHPATRIFQALRIYVNKELENIKGFLVAAMRVLKPDGRLLCISFHSLEDGIVKDFFRSHSAGYNPLLQIITKKVIVAGPSEVKENPSSRSAKLRVAKRLAGQN